MQIAINKALENKLWYDFYNKDGNQGPYKFRPSSFNKIDLGDYKANNIANDLYMKDNWTFWLLKIDIKPLFSNSFLTTSNISEDISITDSSGKSYAAHYKKPDICQPGSYDFLSLHKYDFSIKIPNCNYQASLLFHIPDSDDFSITYNETPKPWYKHESKKEHQNEIALLETIKSESWYKCKFDKSPDMDIRMQVTDFNRIPLTQVINVTKDDNPLHYGYYNIEDCNFMSLSIKVVNFSKGDNNNVGEYLSGRLILLDNTGLYYASSGSASHFSIDFTTSIFGSNKLSQPLTPKIVYDVNVVYLIAKNISSLSLGLRYGTLSPI